jgi:hypothetical protein
VASAVNLRLRAVRPLLLLFWTAFSDGCGDAGRWSLLMVRGKAVLVPVLFLEVELCDGHAGYEVTAKDVWAVYFMYIRSETLFLDYMSPAMGGLKFRRRVRSWRATAGPMLGLLPHTPTSALLRNTSALPLSVIIPSISSRDVSASTTWRTATRSERVSRVC